LLRIEYNSGDGTLVLFIDNVQQPIYFSGIWEKVRFFVYAWDVGATCTIYSLKKLPAPTSKNIMNQQALQW
ncbi:MAG: hypothetical protein EZS28_009211, partial [Streblomastix strix]